jgi:HD-GYP domain-containing protein (c-di-GMP phosphodiesterase class II)
VNPARSPQGAEWGLLVDALHALTNTITVRSHYREGHPAIARAVGLAEASLTRILEAVPQILVSFVDDEFVICERPLPELRERLHVLASAMVRHDIECIVFQRGVTRAECELLGRTLLAPAGPPGRVREQAQPRLVHVLLRSLEVGEGGVVRKAGGASRTNVVPAVRSLLSDVTLALLAEEPIDRMAVLTVANRILGACAARSFALEQRAVVDGRDDGASHAANVALMTGAMALFAGYPDEVCLDVTAAALLHDVGQVRLPRALQYVPEPLLAEPARAVFRSHTTEGALALAEAGCPTLWVAVALEHHRGVDGLGYPALGDRDPPHELVRIVSRANFLDRKRTRLGGVAAEPDEALRLAFALEERYFGRPLVSRCLRALGAYPPGTTVELSNRAPALVTQVNAGDPWRPQVELLRGPESGARVELRDLNAAEGRYELSIARPILPPLFVLADVPVTAEDAPRASTSPRPPTPAPRAPRVARLEELAEEVLSAPAPVPPAPAPPEDADLQSRLLEFLTDPPPALPLEPAPPAVAGSPRASVVPVSPRPGAVTYSAAPPAIMSALSRPPRVGSYSSIPPLAAPGRGPSVPPASPEGGVEAPPSARGRASSGPPPASPESRSSRPPVVAKESGSSALPPASTRSSLAPAGASQPPAASRAPGGSMRPSRAPSRPVPVVVASSAVIARQEGLDPRAAFLLSMVDGAASMDEIVDASGMPSSDAERLVGDLVARGLIAVKPGSV